MSRLIVTASICLVRDGELLSVRKHGSTRFQLPGDKLEADESPRAAAVRETWEETGVRCDPDLLLALGEFEEVAANEPGARVRATVFRADLGAHPAGPVPEPRAEIAEVRWLRIADAPGQELAPLLARHILPALQRATSP